MRLILLILRPIYYLLYHQFAWTYDFIAAVVSLGRWQDWIHCSIPFLNGHVLEIGFGPGHLQKSMNEKGFLAFGLDESRQMARQTSRRLQRQGIISRLVRGCAQNIPFQTGTFDSVVTTFPSEFIFNPRSLKEIRRVLNSDGRLIVLPMAWITGTRPFEQLAAWLFRISGEAPGESGQISPALRERFLQTGFSIHYEIVNLKGSQVLVIVAKKGLIV